MIKKSFFTTSQNRTVYYELNHKENTDTVVFLNGLSDSIDSWAAVKDYLQDSYSTLFIDLIGQGQSLEEELKTNDGTLNFKISTEQQSQAIKEVWDSLNIKTGFHLVGFSYGGGVAIHFATLFPKLIYKLILFLPYTIRLDLAFPLQRLWAGQMGMLKTFNFFKPGMNILGDSYQKMIRDYMNVRFSKHIPDETRRRVSMDLTEGIMAFNAFNIFDQLPEKSVHLVTVERDTLVPKSLYSEIWSRIPESKKCSWLSIKDGEHLIFEQAPLYCAKWIEMTLSFKPMNSENHQPPRTFTGNSYRMETHETTVRSFSHSKIS
jgi:pimeloyl-ACP methyl ester carboxylesterase